MSHREELLEQLKAIRLELFRNAASLDMAIASIERELGNESTDDEPKRMYIIAECHHREDQVFAHDWYKIFELENVVWQQLCKTKEES